MVTLPYPNRGRKDINDQALRYTNPVRFNYFTFGVGQPKTGLIIQGNKDLVILSIVTYIDEVFNNVNSDIYFGTRADEDLLGIADLDVAGSVILNPIYRLTTLTDIFFSVKYITGVPTQGKGWAIVQTLDLTRI